MFACWVIWVLLSQRRGFLGSPLYRPLPKDVACRSTWVPTLFGSCGCWLHSCGAWAGKDSIPNQTPTAQHNWLSVTVLGNTLREMYRRRYFCLFMCNMWRVLDYPCEYMTYEIIWHIQITCDVKITDWNISYVMWLITLIFIIAHVCLLSHMDSSQPTVWLSGLPLLLPPPWLLFRPLPHNNQHSLLILIHIIIYIFILFINFYYYYLITISP